MTRTATAGDASVLVSEKQAVLEMRGVSAGYGRSTVLREIDVAVPADSVVALIGANGAGKTTLLHAAAGINNTSHGKIFVNGRDVTGWAPHRRAEAGLCLIPEGRGIYRALTVRENLRMHVPPWGSATDSVDKAVAAFPVLGERLGQVAGSMSGGQQQQLALARAYLSNPSVVLLDEVSMGLAPQVIDQIFDSFARLVELGASLVIVEQYVHRVLKIADYAYMLSLGEVIYAGPASGLDADQVDRGYFS